MKINVAVAEDNFRLAQSIKQKLELFSDEIDYKYRAQNGKDIIEYLKKSDTIDVVLMDIQMPEMNGVDATSIISELFPNIKIIMLTVFDDEQLIFDSIKAGAMGYLLKDEPAPVIFNSIKDILAGGAPMSPSIAVKSLLLLKNPIKKETNQKTVRFDLSKREIDVLEQISHGYSYKEIAENLFISPATVRKHNENIYKKLQVNNKIRAVKIATKHNII